MKGNGLEFNGLLAGGAGFVGFTRVDRNKQNWKTPMLWYAKGWKNTRSLLRGDARKKNVA